MIKRLAIAAIVSLLAPAFPAVAGDVEVGRKIALTHCSRCHVIPLHNAFGGIGSTPSFHLLANLEDGIERFETFFDRRPHPNFVRLPGVAPLTAQPAALQPFELTPEELEGIVAYAKALREAEQ
jgi:mono/diheme cytochrome c family protein